LEWQVANRVHANLTGLPTSRKLDVSDVGKEGSWKYRYYNKCHKRIRKNTFEPSFLVILFIEMRRMKLCRCLALVQARPEEARRSTQQPVMGKQMLFNI